MTFDEWWNGLQHRRLSLSAKNAARLAWAEKPERDLVPVGWVMLHNDGRIETEINGNVGLTNKRVVTMYVYSENGVAIGDSPSDKEESK